MATCCKSSDINAKLHVNNAKLIVIHTGNIVGELKRKTTLSATDELMECLGVTLASWAKEIDPDNGIKMLSALDCRNTKTSGKISKDERKELKLTVKVMLNSFHSDVLREAIAKAMGELDVACIESVIVAFPLTEDKLKLDEIKDAWVALEELVNRGKILTIGISDLDTDLLIELYNWAKVKPSVSQVNLASCCVIPPEMQAFAKDNDIQLLTHNDPKEILPKSSVCQLLSKTLDVPEDSTWESRWIIRYSALVKCRGVIQNKGFVVCLQNTS